MMEAYHQGCVRQESPPGQAQGPHIRSTLPPVPTVGGAAGVRWDQPPRQGVYYHETTASAWDAVSW